MSRSSVATLFVVVLALVVPALGGATGQATVTSVYTVDGQAVFNTGLCSPKGCRLLQLPLEWSASSPNNLLSRPQR